MSINEHAGIDWRAVYRRLRTARAADHSQGNDLTRRFPFIAMAVAALPVPAASRRAIILKPSCLIS
jgi:hypothetical protein